MTTLARRHTIWRHGPSQREVEDGILAFVGSEAKSGGQQFVTLPRARACNSSLLTRLVIQNGVCSFPIPEEEAMEIPSREDATATAKDLLDELRLDKSSGRGCLIPSRRRVPLVAADGIRSVPATRSA